VGATYLAGGMPWTLWSSKCINCRVPVTFAKCAGLLGIVTERWQGVTQHCREHCGSVSASVDHATTECRVPNCVDDVSLAQQSVRNPLRP
jgi:hypothetical protein